jgi:hypothetical protein
MMEPRYIAVVAGIGCIAAFFALVWYLSRRKRKHPAKTSLQTRILFVLQDSYLPMTAKEIAADTHAEVEEVGIMLNQLVGQERVHASWDGNSPYRMYSIIRVVKT